MYGHYVSEREEMEMTKERRCERLHRIIDK